MLQVFSGIPSFFDAFLTLFRIYVKEVVDRGNQSNIRIWSAGCANGSEPYSIAIVIYQALKRYKSRYRIKNYGTGKNKEILSEAKLGTYS